jgi:amidohydrolase
MPFQRDARILAILLTFVLFSSVLPLSAIDKKTAADIDREIEKIRLDMIKIRHFIHMNPQLAYHEQDTAKIIGAKLASLNVEIKPGIARTGIVALMRGNQAGGTVAVRADLDAVPIQEMADVQFKSLNPGIMHAAGHDIHTAIVLGTAFVLNELKDRIKGNIKFIFQPASESPPFGEEGGAALMIKEGVLDTPPVGAIIGFHVWPENLGQVFIVPGLLLANSDSFEIVIRGKISQGSQPQEGVDVVVLASQVISALQSIVSRSVDPTDPVLLTIGKIEGGTKGDLIADRVRLEGIIRTLSEANRKKIPRLMESVIKGVVQSFGGDYTFAVEEDAPFVVNRPELLDILMPSLNEALGERKAGPIKPQMMADDFALYSQKIPAFYFLLGVKNPRLPSTPPLYSPYFNPDERSIALGIKILSHLLLDCLEQQSRLAKEAF